jgi:predicted phage tail protein
VLAILVVVAGVVMVVAGIGTWIAVQTQLSDERITVSDDATYFAGDRVDGPLSAYSEANTIEKHAMEASGGKTYAELEQDDPTRDTVMTASFLRASLFTSVVSFGVAAMAVGLGIVLVLIGWALLSVAKAVAAMTTAEPAAAPA